MTAEQVWSWWEMAGDVVASLSPVIVFMLALGVALVVARSVVTFVFGLNRREGEGRTPGDSGRR